MQNNYLCLNLKSLSNRTKKNKVKSQEYIDL